MSGAGGCKTEVLRCLLSFQTPPWTSPTCSPSGRTEGRTTTRSLCNTCPWYTAHGTSPCTATTDQGRSSPGWSSCRPSSAGGQVPGAQGWRAHRGALGHHLLLLSRDGCSGFCVQQMPRPDPLGRCIPWGGGGSALQMQQLLKLQVLALAAAQHLVCRCPTTPGICRFAAASKLDAIADMKPPTGS